jgi:mRNA interferase MazF
VVVPITDWKDRYAGYPWMVKIEPSAENGLVKTSAIDCFQIRSVSTIRMIERMGSVTPDVISRAREAVLTVISE